MAKIVFILPSGEHREIPVECGDSLMFAALTNGLDGILAECGGGMVCGTCHVLVDPSRLDQLAPVSAEEDDILECVASGRQANSRLSCQIVMTEELDGLVVTIPDSQ